MRSEERLSLLIRNSSDIVTVINRERNRVYISESVERITGYPPGELRYEPFDSQVIHPDDLEEVGKTLDQLMASPGAQARMVYRHRHKRDGYIYLETICTNMLEDPIIKGVILNSRDFTEVKRVEGELLSSLNQLRQRNHDLEEILSTLTSLTNNLEERVLERTRDVEEKKVEIEQLLKQKDEFIYQLAHDLRTPLTPVVAMLPLLIMGIHDPDAKSLLEIFNTSIQNLQKMVEDIIYYTQLNRQYSVTDYDGYVLMELIHDAIEANSFMADQKELNIEVGIEEDITLRLSRTHARQLFRNLINNAVKFNIFKGVITITARRENGFIVITIADTGVGIPPEQMDRIWDEFVTGDHARNDPKSKGLGLPIIRQIVTLHGGTIQVSSEGTGRGTTFTLKLPDGSE